MLNFFVQHMMWYWAAWLLGIVITFAIPEGIAIWKSGTTFSQFMATMQYEWPLWAPAWGILVGGLFVHFYWHWVPKLPANFPFGK